MNLLIQSSLSLLMFVLIIFRPMKVNDGAALIHFYRNHCTFLDGFGFDLQPTKRKHFLTLRSYQLNFLVHFLQLIIC